MKIINGLTWNLSLLFAHTFSIALLNWAIMKLSFYSQRVLINKIIIAFKLPLGWTNIYSVYSIWLKWNVVGDFHQILSWEIKFN